MIETPSPHLTGNLIRDTNFDWLGSVLPAGFCWMGEKVIHPNGAAIELIVNVQGVNDQLFDAGKVLVGLSIRDLKPVDRDMLSGIKVVRLMVRAPAECRVWIKNDSDVDIEVNVWRRLGPNSNDGETHYRRESIG